jgi:AcrR family transcriptional regulator
MDKRAAFSAGTRRRILEAARRSLAGGRNADLGLDVIANAARVSRVTIYNHFGSRSRLLEGLYDYLATRGRVRRGEEGILQKDPDVVIAGFIRALVGFWSSDPNAIRRLHAMAALDAEIARGLAARETRRRRAAGQIVRRVAPAAKRKRHRRTDRLVADAFCALASFETYDSLARAGHSRGEIIAVMTHLARSVVTRGLRVRQSFRNSQSFAMTNPWRA